MVIRQRNDRGQFERKSDGLRKVRSIRVTDDVWEKVGVIANERGITRADLLEIFVEVDLLSTIAVLKGALKLKANAGGAIKREIESALSHLGESSD